MFSRGGGPSLSDPVSPSRLLSRRVWGGVASTKGGGPSLSDDVSALAADTRARQSLWSGSGDARLDAIWDTLCEASSGYAVQAGILS